MAESDQPKNHPGMRECTLTHFYLRYCCTPAFGFARNWQGDHGWAGQLLIHPRGGALRIQIDLSLPGVVPIVLTRIYRQADNIPRAVGVGATHSYNVFLAGDSTGPNAYTYMDLVRANGGRIHYVAVAKN